MVMMMVAATWTKMLPLTMTKMLLTQLRMTRLRMSTTLMLLFIKMLQWWRWMSISVVLLAIWHWITVHHWDHSVSIYVNCFHLNCIIWIWTKLFGLLLLKFPWINHQSRLGMTFVMEIIVGYLSAPLILKLVLTPLLLWPMIAAMFWLPSVSCWRLSWRILLSPAQTPTTGILWWISSRIAVSPLMDTSVWTLIRSGRWIRLYYMILLMSIYSIRFCILTSCHSPHLLQG